MRNASHLDCHSSAMPSTSANPPPPPPLFDKVLEFSREFMASNPRDATSSSTLLLNTSTTSCITKQYSQVQDLIHTLKHLFEDGLITLQVATEGEVDPATTLDTLASLMAAISHHTEHSSESIARSTLDHLHQLNLHYQQLQNQLVHYNSMGSYLGISSTVFGGFAAFAMAPVGLITVQPLSQLFSTVWKERMINPLEEKLKVVTANRFMIHDMIIKVGKMKDMVQGLVNLRAKREDDAEHDEKKVLEEVEKALVDSIARLQMVELELEI